MPCLPRIEGTGHGWHGGSGETGRRGRRPLQGVFPIEGQSRKKADIHLLPPGERQRKEELVHSITTKTPAKATPRAGDIRKKRKHALRVPRPSSPRRGDTSFSLLDRARPVFSFSSGRKRENGGCNEPAIIMAEIPPARRASTIPPCGGPQKETAHSELSLFSVERRNLTSRT